MTAVLAVAFEALLSKPDGCAACAISSIVSLLPMKPMFEFHLSMSRRSLMSWSMLCEKSMGNYDIGSSISFNVLSWLSISASLT